MTSAGMTSAGKFTQTDLRSILDLPYFHESLSKQQAADILRRYSNEPGRFLLRWSSNRGHIAVSCVVKPGTIGHGMIFNLDYNCFYIENELKFTKLQQLVSYYEMRNLPNFSGTDLSVRLRFPVLKFRRPMPFPWQQDPIEYGAVNEKTYNQIDEHINDWRKRHRLSEIWSVGATGRRQSGPGHFHETRKHLDALTLCPKAQNHDASSISHARDASSASHARDASSASHARDASSASHARDASSTSHARDASSASHARDASSASHARDASSTSHARDASSTSHARDASSASHARDASSTSHARHASSTSHARDASSASHAGTPAVYSSIADDVDQTWSMVGSIESRDESLYLPMNGRSFTQSQAHSWQPPIPQRRTRLRS